MENQVPDFYKNAFWTFVISTDRPNLRSYFDNIKNFAVGLTLFVARAFLLSRGEEKAALFFAALGWTMLVLNIAQLWALVIVGFHLNVGVGLEDVRGRDSVASNWKFLALWVVIIGLIFSGYRLLSVIDFDKLPKCS